MRRISPTTKRIMKEEEERATDSTPGLMQIISKHDTSEDKMTARRSRERKILVAYRKMVLLPREIGGDEDDKEPDENRQATQ